MSFGGVFLVDLVITFADFVLPKNTTEDESDEKRDDDSWSNEKTKKRRLDESR